MEQSGWISNLLIGAAGAIIALVAEQIYVHFKEKRKEGQSKYVTFSNKERLITGDIFNQLGPGSSVELMKKDLGPPNKKTTEGASLLSDEPYCEVAEETPHETNSYLYFFKNAAVKITSKDGETVNSLTVMANGSDISFSNIFYWDGEYEQFLNVATITPEMLEDAKVDEFPGCRDCFTAVHKLIGNPFWIYQTLFCDGAEYNPEQDPSSNPELMVGRVISGICLSDSRDTASYIYTSEYTSAI